MVLLLASIYGCSSNGINANKIETPTATTSVQENLVLDRTDEKNDKLMGISMTYQTKEVQKSMQKLDTQGFQQLKKALEEAFQKDASADGKGFSEMHIIDAKSVKIAKSNEDMIIIAKYRFLPYISHPNSIAIVFLAKDKTHIVKYADEGDIFNYALHDIDSDGTIEVFVTREYNYKITQHVLTVLKYQNDNFLPIFKGSLTYSPFHSRYIPSFSYSVVSNSDNKAFKDILYKLSNMDTGIGPNKDNPVINKDFPLKDTLRFIYNGKKYLPNKKVDGYINFEFGN